MKSSTDKWFDEFVEELLLLYPQIEQLYLLGTHAKGPDGQRPDYGLLIYATYDEALQMLTSLARAQDELDPPEGIVHLFVENYGGTFCGIWGGQLLVNSKIRDWEEDHDFKIIHRKEDSTSKLKDRLVKPDDRRIGERRAEESEVDSDLRRGDRRGSAVPEYTE